ncbi:MAG: glucosaminidase domain-containing protein [Bacteroidota bacterium]
MNKLRLFFILMVTCSGSLSAQQADYKSQVIRYIIQYRDIAVKEMTVSHVPASITMAQGIFESNAGQSDLAKEANNHFGIKCHKEWTGDKMYKDDDKPHDCFRKYATVQESFHDHSSFLVERDRYKPLFQLKITDYREWALGLKKAGYATNPAYAEKLIHTIEAYQLYKLDRDDFGVSLVDSLKSIIYGNVQPVLTRKAGEPGSVTGSHPVFMNNRLRVTMAREGDDLKQLSALFQISERKLRKFNELADDRLSKGDLVYLESKRRRAEVRTHLLEKGETLHHVAQKYGIKIKMIYKRNHIPAGHEPSPGRLLLLR